MRNLLFTVTLVALPGAAVFAADEVSTNSFTHAAFVQGGRSMKSLIDFPDIDFDTEVIVTCAGHATAKGRLKDARCSSPGDPELKFTMAVSRRFNSSRLIPATVNGKAEEVDFQFTVIFRKEGESETFDVYPHNMKNVDRLGLEYMGAQRYSPHPWPGRCGNKRFDEMVMEVAIISALGRPTDMNVMTANFGLSASCREGFLTALHKGRWIPALYDGEFVEAVWTNPRVIVNVPYKRQQ
jgi:hypothetical protein